MGKIYSASLSEINKLIKLDNRIDASTIYLVTRSSKISESAVKNGWNYMQNLGPSWELFTEVKKLKERGMWNKRLFNEMYTKEYKNQISCDTDAMKNIIKITEDVYKDKDVYIVCYCDEPDMCHRTILCELLNKITGLEVINLVS